MHRYRSYWLKGGGPSICPSVQTCRQHRLTRHPKTCAENRAGGNIPLRLLHKKLLIFRSNLHKFEELIVETQERLNINPPPHVWERCRSHSDGSNSPHWAPRTMVPIFTSPPLPIFNQFWSPKSSRSLKEHDVGCGLRNFHIRSYATAERLRLVGCFLESPGV